MAVKKMKFVSIVGELDHFDRFVSNHIIDSNLHPENALNVITLVRGIAPFPDEESKSDLLLRTCVSLMDLIGIDYGPAALEPYYGRDLMSPDAIERGLAETEEQARQNRDEHSKATERLRNERLMKESLESLTDLNVNVEEFFSLEFVKFRFGKVPKESFKSLKTWADELEMIMLPLMSDEEYSWLIYFTPSITSEKVDGVVSSMHFERTRLSSSLSGFPKDALKAVNAAINELQAQLAALGVESGRLKELNADKLLHIYSSLIRISRNHEVRRNAACTENSFYICGWIPEEDLGGLAKAIREEAGDAIVEEDPSLIKHVKPPTELKNPFIFRFFEILIKMYGLPAYDEVDPTIFVAITYFIMFGIMFGDVGQGLVILLAGIVLVRRKFSLAGVFMCVGVSSTIFGLIYGSLFGDETLLPSLYGSIFGAPGSHIQIISPMEDTTVLLIGGVIFGVILMLSATAINIINGIREKNVARVLFDRNGAAGTIFYVSILLTAVFYLINGSYFIPFAIIAAIITISLLAIFFKEPLERLLEHKRFLPQEKGMFFVQGLFEMIEILLSMTSNTLSFIRVGAFAINHVGLFMAFHILSDMAGNTGGIFVNIFANVLIIGLEGLIVGIQCLRLEYYELFSRFFKGDGKAYRPLRRSI